MTDQTIQEPEAEPHAVTLCRRKRSLIKWAFALLFGHGLSLAFQHVTGSATYPDYLAFACMALFVMAGASCFVAVRAARWTD